MLATVVGGRAVPDALDEATLFRLPLSSDTSVHYYFDRDPTAGIRAWNGTTQTYNGHTGNDYSGGPRSRPIYAAADGILTARVDAYGDFEGPGNGNYIRLNHGNDRNGNPINTFYLHMERGTPINQPPGTFIAAGTQIGGVGTSGNSTGLHLHFHFTYGGTAMDPYAAAGETTWWVNQGSGAPSTATPAKKFQIGQYVEVFALNGSTLTVRAPDPNSASIGTQTDGAIGQVLEGPVLSYTGTDMTGSVYNRYKVRFTNGMEGWAAQNWLRVASLPEIAVSQGATPITDGQAGAINFGSAPQASAGPTRVFTVSNIGTAPLTLAAPTLPTGYTLIEDLSSSIAAGSFDTFTVRLDTATMGTKSGQISFSNNDLDENPFNFPITGVVTPPPGPTVDIHPITPNPFDGPLTSNITMVFSEAVSGFALDDITLRRNGTLVPLTADQTLTTSDNITFTLGNLAPLTPVSGTYEVRISGGVTDGAGTAMTVGDAETVKVQTNLFRGDGGSVVNDFYYLRKSLDGSKLDVFENVSLFNPPTYTLNWAGLSSITIDAGGGNNTFTVNYTRGDPVPAGASGMTLLASGGANTLTFGGTGTLALHASTVSNVSNLTLTAGNSSVILHAPQQLTALTLGASGTLDVASHAMSFSDGAVNPVGAWNGSAYTGVTGMIQSGRIIASQGYGIGIAPFWAGARIRATHTGDANLDGVINGDDFFALDAGFAATATGYANGDFDLNGRIDADDYWLIDSNYGHAAAAPPARGNAAGAELPDAPTFAEYRRSDDLSDLV